MDAMEVTNLAASDDNAGDPMEIDSPSFNPGRRRKFDEFVLDEPEQMDREHRPLHHQLPITFKRRFGAPVDAPQEPDFDRTWTKLVCNTLRKGTKVVAVMSTTCRRGFGTRRLGRPHRCRIFQTCNAAVQSSCNAAKRCLVTLTAVVQEPWSFLSPRPPPPIAERLAMERRARRDQQERQFEEEMAAHFNPVPSLPVGTVQHSGLGSEMEYVQGTGPEPVVEDVQITGAEPVMDVVGACAPEVVVEDVEEEDVEMEDVSGAEASLLPEEIFDSMETDIPINWQHEELPPATDSDVTMSSEGDDDPVDEMPETPSHPFGSFPVQIAPTTPSSGSPSQLGGFSGFPHPSQLTKNIAVDVSSISVASANATTTTSQYHNQSVQALGNSFQGMQILPNSVTQISGLGIQTPSRSQFDPSIGRYSGESFTQYREPNRKIRVERARQYEEEGMQDPSNGFTQSFDESIANDFVEKSSDPSKVGESPRLESESMEDLLSDTSEVEESYQARFDNMAVGSKTCDQLVTTHDSGPNSTLIAMDSFHESSVQWIPQTSGIPAQAAIEPLNSMNTPVATVCINAREDPSNLEVKSHPSTPKQAPKKSVAFFESPKTGRPITATKKFIMGEPISFPVSSSPPSEASSLSMISSRGLSDSSSSDAQQAETYTHNLKHQNANIANDRHLPMIDSNGFDFISSPSMHSELAHYSQDFISENKGKLPEGEEGLSQETSVSVVEVDKLARDGESVAVEDSDPTSTEQVSSLSSSESENRIVDHKISKSSRHEKAPAASSALFEKKKPTRASTRYSRKYESETKNLAVSLSSLDVSKRRGSSRVVARQMKGEAQRQEQAAHEAAERTRIAKKEEEDKARKEAEAEEERRKNIVRRFPKEKIIQPLDASWEEKVERALNTQDMRKVLVSLSSGVNLTRRDIGTLKVVRGRDPAHGWLNDEIIAACLQQVVDYGLRISNYNAGETPKYHAFNTFFYKNLRDKGAQSIKRWASKANIGKENLLKVEQVFIPVHQGQHWTLLVVSPFKRKIEYFDSMGGQATPYILNVKKWLAEELGKSWKEQEWTIPTGDYGAGPRQENGSDCGVFTCTTARMVIMGVDPMAYGGNDMAMQRSRMVAELLNGGLVGDFEPRVVF